MESADPIESIPEPDAVRAMLAESVRKSVLLRSLLNVAVRKAAYDRPQPLPEVDRSSTLDALPGVSRG